jgi:hypothetical protein
LSVAFDAEYDRLGIDVAPVPVPALDRSAMGGKSEPVTLEVLRVRLVVVIDHFRLVTGTSRFARATRSLENETVGIRVSVCCPVHHAHRKHRQELSFE